MHRTLFLPAKQSDRQTCEPFKIQIQVLAALTAVASCIVEDPCRSWALEDRILVTAADVQTYKSTGPSKPLGRMGRP